MKFYLKVPYGEHRQAKAFGALWEPSSKLWYCVSETVRTRCSRWALPLTEEQKNYLDAPGRTTAFSRAMDSYKTRFRSEP